MEVSKNTTNNQYIQGDFDKDRVKNIDDTYPFDKKRSKPKENKNFWMKSRYTGGEVKLSSELKAIKQHNDSFSPRLQQLLRENKGSYGRIKTVPSTMKKLRERYILSLGDVAGATITTKNRKEAYAKERSIKKRYATDKASRDDYYKKPKGDVYYAIHNKVLLKKGDSRGIELQIKSKKMANLGKEIHPYYKKGTIPVFFKRKAKKLYKLGY